MLWDQHRDRFRVGEYTARRITYTKYTELTADISDADMAALGRLNAKRESGDTLTQEETDRLTALALRWPIDALRGACLIPPVPGDEVGGILASMPRKESEELERILDMCITPDMKKEEITDPLAVQLAARGGLGIDMADLTVGQGLALIALLSPREV